MWAVYITLHTHHKGTVTGTCHIYTQSPVSSDTELTALPPTPRHRHVGFTDLACRGMPHFEGTVIRSTDNPVAMEFQTRHL